MSQTETHYGKLRKVEITIPLEDWCREKCIEAGITEIHSWNSDWQEEFREEYNRTHFFIDGEIWEAFEHIRESDGDIDILLPNPDGTITFIQQFYNGGTCLSECLEDGIRRLNKQKNN